MSWKAIDKYCYYKCKKKHKQNEREVKQTKTFQKEKKCYCKNVTIDICQSMFKILHFWFSDVPICTACVLQILQLHIHSTTTNLTLSWWRPLSYRNQSIDLQSKSMDWFLHDNDLRHERVKLITFCSSYEHPHPVTPHIPDTFPDKLRFYKLKLSEGSLVNTRRFFILNL